MRNFANTLITPFNGVFGAQPISAHRKSASPPQAIALDINWKQYALAIPTIGGATTFNAGVAIDLGRNSVSAPLDIVKSVFIDNTAVDRPVYLRCDDTGHIITCPDGFFGWYPVWTNNDTFTLFTDNIVPLRNGNEVTKLLFSNASFDTFGQPELNRAQALYRSSGAAQFTTPVIGDQFVSYASPVNTGVSPTLAPAVLNRQYVITAISLVFNNTSSSVAGAMQIAILMGTVKPINSVRYEVMFNTSNQAVNYNNLNIAGDIGAAIVGSFSHFVAASANVVVGISYAAVDFPALS